MLLPSAPSRATSRWIRAGLVFVGGAGLLLGFLVVRPDCMVVERVEMRGLHRASPEALRHLADIPNGTTIWQVDLEDAALGVERHPWVRSARASRQWPDRVVFEVEEYEPVALLQYDALYYVDAEGTPFVRGVTEALDFPVLTGIEPELEQVHPDLPRLAVRDALWLIEALDGRGLVGRQDISEVHFDRVRGFTVQTVGARLAFDLDDLERQVARLQVLVDRGAVALDQPRWVDLAPESVAIVRPLESVRSTPFAHSGRRTH